MVAAEVAPAAIMAAANKVVLKKRDILFSFVFAAESKKGVTRKKLVSDEVT